MTKRVKCEYLSDDGLCKAVVKNPEGRALRDEFCVNEIWNFCCYTCPSREACEISCNYLEKEVLENQSTNRINQEISKYQKSIEKLSVFFAEGKISEESYLRSVRRLESIINNLKGLKKNNEAFDDEERSLVEKPSAAWYLVRFFLD
ncbi:MAG: hypothetical protein QXZ02_04120 [Candidatus Bathyarchaeia archaeon]